MKDKILQEAIEWYEKNGKNSDVYIDDFIDLIFNRTTDAVLEEVKNELKNEFEKGTLKHPFVISSDYYLELKFKEIKEKFLKDSIKTDSE
ncbi:MAG: hypothetical protein QHH19_06765 [Candidatus Thermoplasmatota archaeon]|jgi:hypothetical protein|nr:hypothetical protein [Candidatus Thermoplasmatota archaeon]